jgi:general secretion pathway protein L
MGKDALKSGCRSLPSFSYNRGLVTDCKPMPERLFIRLAPNGDLSWSRQTADVRSSPVTQQGAPPASALAAVSEIVVLVPSEDVLLLETRLAARNAAQRLQAVPFAVEDQLLGAIEDQHFALATGASDQVGVAVVARERMQTWIERLGSAGIHADVLVPESLAVPFDPEAINVLPLGARVIARSGPWSGFACPKDDLPSWLEGESSRRVAMLADAQDGATVDPLLQLAECWQPVGLNLLSGEFAPAHRQARGTRWWRRAMALAAAVVLLVLGLRVLEVTQLSRQIDRIDAAMTDSLLRTFPDLGAAERTRAAQSVMRDRLERLRGGNETSGLLRILGQIAPTLGTTTRTQTRGMEYRNGILEIGLRAPDVATLDSMRERLAAIPGLTAEVTAANPVDAGVDGRIRISGVAP